MRPTHGGFWFLVRLLPGQVPEDFVQAGPAMAHDWQMHAVRVTTWRPGIVRIAATYADPLKEPRLPRQREAARLLRVSRGTLEGFSTVQRDRLGS